MISRRIERTSDLDDVAQQLRRQSCKESVVDGNVVPSSCYVADEAYLLGGLANRRDHGDKLRTDISGKHSPVIACQVLQDDSSCVEPKGKSDSADDSSDHAQNLCYFELVLLGSD